MDTVIRQVRFPLKLKLLSLMIILIAGSLIVFVGIALKTFREDKSAYIFESMLNKAGSESVLLSQKLGSTTLSVNQAKTLAGIAQEEEESSFEVKIIVPEQENLFRFEKDSFHPLSDEESAILRDFRKVPQGVRETKLNGETYLYAWNYDPVKNFIYAVSLTQEKAYSATAYLINKSLFYGLFILGIAMVVSVLLARPMTSQLETLTGMTREIAQGNFSKRVKLNAHDEVGVLSDSVNDMADKIVAYMEEMKEKARLENEVEVARLVQSSFFPPDEASDSILEVRGHFEPASECGGDWWGYFDHDDWRVFFIADATGHGVPAALLTATMNCCKTSLRFILETRPELISQPHEILRYMNTAVCGAGKEIQVTCFVATFNRKTRKLLWSNSSQTPPLLFSG